MNKKKNTLRIRRKIRIRAKISGTATRPRLVIFKSLSNHFAQLVNDEKRVTIIGLGDSTDKSKKNKLDRAKKLGEKIAKKAVELKIKECVFDRNGYKYTGRVQAFAEAAREHGLKF